jgi:hypothetical protein
MTTLTVVTFLNFVNAPKNRKEVGATAMAAGGCSSCAAGKMINPLTPELNPWGFCSFNRAFR